MVLSCQREERGVQTIQPHLILVVKVVLLSLVEETGLLSLILLLN